MNIKSIDIVIPVLNEEKYLADCLNQLFNFMKNDFAKKYPELKYQIIIADNGSTDRTPEISQQMCIKFSQLKYIKINKIGVGIALKKAWSSSNAEIVGYMDLDLATDLKHLLETVDLLNTQQVDIINGTRLNKNSKVINRSLKREITSNVFNFILRHYLDVKFTDGMCGFKFIKKTVFDFLLEQGLENDGWFMATELLVKAERNQFKILEIPVQWTDKNESKAKIMKLTFQYLKSMRKLKK